MHKIICWLVAAGIPIVVLLLTANILAPFFIAFIIAYILQPLIDNSWLKDKLPRSIVSCGVFIIFLGAFILSLIILLPIIYHQISLLISKIPIYKHYLQSELAPVFTAKIHSIDPSIANKIKDSFKTIIDSAFTTIVLIINNIWSYTMATINIMTIILLVPVILFYFLRDWPKMIKTLENLLPARGKGKIREIFSSINELLSAYIRGQFNVCLLLSGFYWVGLSIIGLDSSLLLGILSGFLIIVPFIGTLISFSFTMIIGYFTWGLAKLSYIIILYVAGYIIESYILTPKIIGDKIGLHPLWIMFAVFACGSLFGLIGIFFAIPIAGIIKVLLKFAVISYKSSKIYKT